MKREKDEVDLLASLNILDSMKFISESIFHKLGHTKVPRPYDLQNLIPFHNYQLPPILLLTPNTHERNTNILLSLLLPLYIRI